MTPMIPRQQIHTNGAWDYAYDEAAFSHSKTVSVLNLSLVRCCAGLLGTRRSSDLRGFKRSFGFTLGGDVAWG